MVPRGVSALRSAALSPVVTLTPFPPQGGVLLRKVAQMAE